MWKEGNEISKENFNNALNILIEEFLILRDYRKTLLLEFTSLRVNINEIFFQQTKVSR